MICRITSRARPIGIAKPMFWDPSAGSSTRVLMPTSSPRALINAPPLLPRLIAASVWMKSS